MNGDTKPTGQEDLLAPVITDDDHDRGWVDVTVEFRSGRRALWRVSALNYRDAQAALQELLKSADTVPLIERCLPLSLLRDDGRSLLDRLTPHSAGIVEEVVLVLCFGESFKKKLEAIGRLVTGTQPDAPKSSSLAGDSNSPKSEPGVFPSSIPGCSSSSKPGCETSRSSPSP